MYREPYDTHFISFCKHVSPPQAQGKWEDIPQKVESIIRRRKDQEHSFVTGPYNSRKSLCQKYPNGCRIKAFINRRQEKTQCEQSQSEVPCYTDTDELKAKNVNSSYTLKKYLGQSHLSPTAVSTNSLPYIKWTYGNIEAEVVAIHH